MIDSALIRPGRFDKLIYVPPLDKDGRLELLRICAQTTPFSPEVNFEEIAENTHHFSGADVVNLCREVCLLFGFYLIPSFVFSIFLVTNPKYF